MSMERTDNVQRQTRCDPADAIGNLEAAGVSSTLGDAVPEAEPFLLDEAVLAARNRNSHTEVLQEGSHASSYESLGVTEPQAVVSSVERWLQADNDIQGSTCQIPRSTQPNREDDIDDEGSFDFDNRTGETFSENCSSSSEDDCSAVSVDTASEASSEEVAADGWISFATRRVLIFEPERLDRECLHCAQPTAATCSSCAGDLCVWCAAQHQHEQLPCSGWEAYTQSSSHLPHASFSMRRCDHSCTGDACMRRDPQRRPRCSGPRVHAGMLWPLSQHRCGLCAQTMVDEDAAIQPAKFPVPDRRGILDGSYFGQRRIVLGVTFVPGALPVALQISAPAGVSVERLLFEIRDWVRETDGLFPREALELYVVTATGDELRMAYDLTLEEDGTFLARALPWL